MRTADLLTAALLIAVGALVLGDALRLGIGWGTDGPQSGFFPFWLAVIMITTCLGIIVQALRRPARAPFIAPGAVRPVLKMLLPAAGFVVLTQFLGLYVAATVYMASYMRWIGRHSWPAVILTSIGFSVVTFVIFERWFLVPMPKGPVEHWLGY